MRARRGGRFLGKSLHASAIGRQRRIESGQVATHDPSLTSIRRRALEHGPTDQAMIAVTCRTSSECREIPFVFCSGGRVTGRRVMSVLRPRGKGLVVRDCLDRSAGSGLSIKLKKGVGVAALVAAAFGGGRSGTRWRCGVRRSVWSGGSGTCGSRGWRGDRLHGGTLDCPFVGDRTVPAKQPGASVEPFVRVKPGPCSKCCGRAASKRQSKRIHRLDFLDRPIGKVGRRASVAGV